MSGIESLPNAGRRLGYDLFNSARVACPESDVTYSTFTYALSSKLLGVSLDVLRASTPHEPGIVRDCLLVARACRGDGTAKAEMRRLVREHPSPLVRKQALAAFENWGTTEDLSILEEVVRQDPAVQKKWMPHILRSEEDEIPRDYYPLREMAKLVINAIQKRESAPSGTNSPAGKPGQK
jgi:hypothetical protein